MKTEHRRNNLCFLDTCILSDCLENEALMKGLINFTIKEKCFLGITAQTIGEIHKSTRFYTQIQQYLRTLPFFLTKTKKLLFAEEVENYPVSKPISPIYTLLQVGEKDLKDFLDSVVINLELEYTKGAKQEINKSISNIKSNFQPNLNSKYSDIRVKEFCETVTMQQLVRFHQSQVKITDPITFDYFHFQSIYATALVTFWKFYKVDGRKIRVSDAFDIANSSVLPYFDIAITEKSLASDIQQIKKKSLGFVNLKRVMTISDLDAYC